MFLPHVKIQLYACRRNNDYKYRFLGNLHRFYKNIEYTQASSGAYKAWNAFAVCAVLFFTVVTVVGYFSCYLYTEQLVIKYNKMNEESEKE